MLDLFPSREAGRFGRRLKRARGARIPVTVVTGFLGAGKTTLLRRFLATAEGAGTAVVINEFGSVGIDDALVRGSADEVTLLGNGCLCCNTRSDLQIALRNLVAERAQGAVPQFRRIVIEADASSTGAGRSKPGFVAEAEHSDGIASFVLSDEGSVAWDAFARGMETLIALRGADLLRVKGFLNVIGCRGPVLIQAVQHLVHPPVELAAWPSDDHHSRLVFITKDIRESEVRALFAAVQALAAEDGGAKLR